MVDVRVSRLEDAARIERRSRAARPAIRASLRGDRRHQPAADGADRRRRAPVRARARGGGGAGLGLAEGATGGGSDGNFTAALGVPTLDGLGAVGDGAHALHEHVIIKDLALRAALVPGLLARLGDNGLAIIRDGRLRIT